MAKRNTKARPSRAVMPAGAMDTPLGPARYLAGDPKDEVRWASEADRMRFLSWVLKLQHDIEMFEVRIPNRLKRGRLTGHVIKAYLEQRPASRRRQTAEARSVALRARALADGNLQREIVAAYRRNPNKSLIARQKGISRGRVNRLLARES